jgi:hypothetical protein
MSRLLLLLLLFSACCGLVNAQQNIVFKPIFEKQELILEKEYPLHSGAKVQFEKLRFYISNLRLLDNGKPVFTEVNSFHLIDVADTLTMQLRLNAPRNIVFNQLSFNLGIDSVTNMSGALGGDLDPTKGMYWTWQSGYINFMLEGTSPICLARNHQFQFHLGGYNGANIALQTITLDARQSPTISVEFDVERWLSKIDLSTENHIMSPSVKAVSLSKQAADSFIIPAK